MKIMVGYDGSRTAIDALQLAKKFAKAFDAIVHIVTTLTQIQEVKEKDVDKMDDVHSHLEEIREDFKESKIPCVTRLVVNDLPPGENLVQYAADNQIDQIILGVRKKSKVGKFIFGSTVQYVILESHCPVTTVK